MIKERKRACAQAQNDDRRPNEQHQHVVGFDNANGNHKVDTFILNKSIKCDANGPTVPTTARHRLNQFN